MTNVTTIPAPFCIGLHATLVNGTCVCNPGYGPDGLCFFDLSYYDTAEYNGFLSFFLCVYTMLAFLSVYEVLYSLFKKDLKFSFFYVSRIITFGLGLGESCSALLLSYLRFFSSSNDLVLGSSLLARTSSQSPN